jgi:AcrR family transcriptional regulator
MMPGTERPLRADARRNREKIIESALTLFASKGNEAQMDEIAAHSGLGMGTLYRHFSSKRALLTAMVQERFRGLSDLARTAERIGSPWESFETLLRSYLEAAEGDASFQLALMGSGDVEWSGVRQEKAEFTEIAARIIERALAAGAVRSDLTPADFLLLARSVVATMYFKSGGGGDWRRHLELVLGGIHGPDDQR